MRLSLFSRLVLGYLVVFALVMAVSIYAVGELRRFEDITRSILDRDNRVLDYEKKLADSFLSQIRYERKFTIAKDQALYREFLKFKGDFEHNLEETRAVADSKSAAMLDQVKEDYQRYQDLFAKETVQIRAHLEYSQDWYNKEKSKFSSIADRAATRDFRQSKKSGGRGRTSPSSGGHDYLGRFSYYPGAVVCHYAKRYPAHRDFKEKNP